MGFKIDSLSTLSTIANNLSTTASEATAKLTQTLNALDELVSNVKGGTVNTELNKLETALDSTGKSATNLLTDISTFISSQVGSYSTNEESTLNELEQIRNELEGLGA